MAAILDLRLPVTSDGIRNSNIEFLDPENRGSRWNLYPKYHRTRDTMGGHFTPPPLATYVYIPYK